ncbi:MAG TPA: hypothetical protein VJ598_04200 [Albitalea sp.]|nr:hypothetical protein [Albitalea sp.]
MQILWAVALGALAGAVDVAPMLMRGTSWRDAAVPFVHWVVTAVFIASVSWPLHPALRGALVGLLASLPTLVRYANTQPGAVVPVLTMGLLLGAVLGFVLSLPFFAR